MGEIADLMINGFLDSETGELIDGDAPGYPRRKRRSRVDSRPRCPICGKRCKTAQGVRDHVKDKHETKGPPT